MNFLTIIPAFNSYKEIVVTINLDNVVAYYIEFNKCNLELRFKLRDIPSTTANLLFQIQEDFPCKSELIKETMLQLNLEIYAASEKITSELDLNKIQSFIKEFVGKYKK